MWLTKIAILLAIGFQLVYSYYSDAKARHVLWPLSVNAYITDEAELRNCINKQQGFEFITQVTVPCLHQFCSAFIAISHPMKAIFVVFCGTQMVSRPLFPLLGIQLIEESIYTIFKDMVPYEDNSEAKVNPYFKLAYDNLWARGLNKTIRDLTKKYPTYDYYVTGHSLGGALATLSRHQLFKLRDNGHQDVIAYTFGEPKVGNQAFAKYGKGMVWRVVHKYDLIAQIPFDKDYVFHAREVWYDNDMSESEVSYTICQDNNYYCKGGYPKPEISIGDHYDYFGLSKAVFAQSCVDFHLV